MGAEELELAFNLSERVSKLEGETAELRKQIKDNQASLLWCINTVERKLTEKIYRVR